MHTVKHKKKYDGPILRIGVIGLGVISKYYLAAFDQVEGIQLCAVCDHDSSKYRHVEDDIRRYGKHTELLEDHSVDAVIVNLPNDLHYPVCREALNAGKHVCCEKPLTLLPEHSEELAALSAACGKSLFTAFHRRYNHPFQAMLAELGSNQEIRSVRARYFEKIEDHAGNDLWYLEPNRCGGGCIADNGPNVHDALSSFLGKMSVQQTELRRNSQGIDMWARIDLKTHSGIPVEIELDWDWQNGELKDIEVELKCGQVLRADMLDKYPEFKSSLFHEYVGILDAFKDVVFSGEGHGEEGLNSTYFVDQAYKAAGEVCS